MPGSTETSEEGHRHGQGGHDAAMQSVIPVRSESLPRVTISAMNHASRTKPIGIGFSVWPEDDAAMGLSYEHCVKQFAAGSSTARSDSDAAAKLSV